MGLSKQLYEQFQQDFITRCEEYENGNIGALECASEFREEMDYLTALSEERKAWMNENVDAITDEAEAYGKEGYKGKIFTKQTKTSYSFKHIPAWKKLETEKKDLEAKSKLALKMVEKGGLNVDENGEEIPLPEVSVSSFIKVEKAK